MLGANKLSSALCWSSLDYFIRFILSFVVTIVLSRILSPEEFGLIALLSLFFGLAASLSDCGMTAALIQSQNVKDVDVSTVFWFNILVSILLVCILYLIAPWIAFVFNHPILNNLTKILSSTIVINAIGSVHATLLTKNFNFKTLMKVGSMTAATSGVVGISLAMLGYGVWSLAGQALASSIMSTLLLWHYSSWRPLLIFNINSIIRFLKFGVFICIADVNDVIYNKIYVVVLSRLYGFFQLGLFHRAYNLQQVPVGIISGVVDRISFPLFSSLLSDICKLKKMVQFSIKLTMFLCVPVMVGLIVVADIVINVTFGEKWIDCIPIFQILCFSGILWPMHVVNLSVLKAQGQSSIFLRIDVLKKIIGTLVLFLCSFFGVDALACGIVLVGIISCIINAYFTGKSLNYGFMLQIKDVCPFFFVGSLMSVSVFYLKKYIEMDEPIKLLLLVLIGSFLYIIIGLVFNIDFFKKIIRYIMNNLLNIYKIAIAKI